MSAIGGGLRALEGLARVPVAAIGSVADAVLVRVVDRALSGPLVEAVSRDIVRYSVLERAAEPLARAGFADEVAARILDGPELERIVGRALDSPAVERLVARVIDSRALDVAVARLLESEDLWILVEQIARSPAVTDAIGRQGQSFAEEVAGVVRGRSRAADDRVERLARRLARRRPAPVAETE
jgi:hypothetical protein